MRDGGRRFVAENLSDHTGMWRKTSFEENQASDQSISEEEDFILDRPENRIALGVTVESKGGIQIQSQLELLRDTSEPNHGAETTNLLQKKIGLHSSGSNKLDGACTRSAVTKEAEALVHLMGNFKSSSSRTVTRNVKKPCKGGRVKFKSKFLNRLQQHMEDTRQPVDRVDADNISSEGEKQPEIYGVPTEMTIGPHYPEYSMAELLDSYQEKTGLIRENSKMYPRPRGRRMKLVDQRKISSVVERNADDDDPLEVVGSGSSNDVDLNPQTDPQNLGLITPEYRQKTLTDKFQEALAAASVNSEGPHFAVNGVGLFGKLQCVMQSEKKTDMGFAKRLQTGVSLNDEEDCMDVEILSRCLEAKLTVCHCSRDKECSEWAEDSQTSKASARTLTVIFCSRLCADVELEVGNFIRIHSPWKEVNIRGKDEVIILSTYFSRISA